MKKQDRNLVCGIQFSNSKGGYMKFITASSINSHQVNLTFTLNKPA